VAVDCGAASAASSGGGVGDWPSAVMARASQQKLRMSLSFIVWCLAVGCNESWTWIQVFLKTQSLLPIGHAATSKQPGNACSTAALWPSAARSALPIADETRSQRVWRPFCVPDRGWSTPSALRNREPAIKRTRSAAGR